MAAPSNSEDTRFGYKKEAQDLFINKCNDYTEIVEFENGEKETIHRSGATIQVASLRYKPPRIKAIKDYFRGLLQMNYRSVTIESVDIADMRMSKLQPYGKDSNGKQLYIFSVYFDQVITGVTSEGREYKDISHKWVVCYINENDYIGCVTGEILPDAESKIKYGDVHVNSIEKLW